MENLRTPLLNRGWLQTVLLILGVAFAVALVDSSFIDRLMTGGRSWQVVIIFVIGFFYSSVLTAVPATVGLVKLAQTGAPISLIVLVGGIGAMLGDLTLFKLMKVGFLDALVARLRSGERGVYTMLVHIRLFRYALIALGAIVIATPIPDEIGLAMMGLGVAKWRFVALIGFIFNMIGIAAIVSLAR